VYQWSFKRSKRDDRTINLMIAKAEKIASGAAPLRKARFLKVTGAAKGAGPGHHRPGAAAGGDLRAPRRTTRRRRAPVLAA
jgi:hypothetical protein